jgi:hypothetical protein
MYTRKTRCNRRGYREDGDRIMGTSCDDDCTATMLYTFSANLYIDPKKHKILEDKYAKAILILERLGIKEEEVMDVEV